VSFKSWPRNILRCADPEPRIGIRNGANRISDMAIGLNQHSRQSVIPSTVNQVSHNLEFLALGRVSDDIERIRLLIFFFVLSCLDRFAILYSPMNAMSRPALPADNRQQPRRLL
jgi:hypothetical protein